MKPGVRLQDDPDVQQVMNEFKLDLKPLDQREQENPTVDQELTVFEKLRILTCEGGE